MGFRFAEVSYREGVLWKRWEAEPTAGFWIEGQMNGGSNMAVRIEVPMTNAPLRAVFELEEAVYGYNQPPAGKVGQFFWKLRVRWRQVIHPRSHKFGLPKGPVFLITNEFNFARERN